MESTVYVQVAFCCAHPYADLETPDVYYGLYNISNSRISFTCNTDCIQVTVHVGMDTYDCTTEVHPYSDSIAMLRHI